MGRAINTFMDMILEFISDKPWFGLVAAIIAAAAAFCAATPTPKEGTWISKAYKAIEFLALNIGKAKAKAVVAVSYTHLTLPTILRV